MDMNVINKMKEKISDYMNPNNERAYNKFSEEQKEEMLESLKMEDSIDLYWLDFSDLWESTVDSRWDTVDFKKWVVQKDKIWNYIMINWVKCREYQPWISWFVYKDIRNRYHPREWLCVWFCEKWLFKKSVTIDESFWPKTVDIIPVDINEELWWPFYKVEDVRNLEKWPLHDIMWNDIYYSKYNESEWSDFSESAYDIKDDIIHENDWDISLKIKWKIFKEYKAWASWFIYKEFWDPYGERSNYLLLAEYKDWKMIWKWIILTPIGKTYIIAHSK